MLESSVVPLLCTSPPLHPVPVLDAQSVGSELQLSISQSGLRPFLSLAPPEQEQAGANSHFVAL